jgi:hypothetical protein
VVAGHEELEDVAVIATKPDPEERLRIARPALPLERDVR